MTQDARFQHERLCAILQHLLIDCEHGFSCTRYCFRLLHAKCMHQHQLVAYVNIVCESVLGLERADDEVFSFQVPRRCCSCAAVAAAAAADGGAGAGAAAGRGAGAGGAAGPGAAAAATAAAGAGAGAGAGAAAGAGGAAGPVAVAVATAAASTQLKRQLISGGEDSKARCC